MANRPSSLQGHQSDPNTRTVSLTPLVLCAFLCYLAASGCGSSPSPSSLSPIFTTIDAPGAADQSGLGTSALDIDEGGDIAGLFSDANNIVHGFVRNASGVLTVFDAPGLGAQNGDATEIFGINNVGIIVGFFNSSGQTEHGFTRAANGSFTVFDPPEAGSHGSFARGINDSGAIVGFYIDANLVPHGYLRNPDGTFITLDDPSAAQLPESLTSIGTAPSRINATGAIVGVFTDSSGVRHGFVWE